MCLISQNFIFLTVEDQFEPPQSMTKSFDNEEEAKQFAEDLNENTEAKVDHQGDKWVVSYMGRKRVRKSFKKKKEAEAELGKRVSLIAEKKYLEIKKDYTTTLDKLIEKYTENFENQASFQNGKRSFLKSIKEFFGEKTLLANIRYLNLETYRNHLRNKPTFWGSPRKDASVNREMACLRHMLKKAVEWEMMEQTPFDKGKSLHIKENNKRYRFLSEEEIQKLLPNCPPYLRNIVECALNTGMRRGEILSLKWSQVRDGLIYLDKTKTNEARQVPVNDDLENLFERMKKGQDLPKENVIGLDGKPIQKKQPKPTHLFNYRGNPVSEVKKSFKTAMKNAKIENFRFHDLRHTFASHFIMRGGTIKELQEILGHKDVKMTMRYAHLSQEHKKKAVNRLNGLTAISQVSQNCHNSFPEESQQAVTT